MTLKIASDATGGRIQNENSTDAIKIDGSGYATAEVTPPSTDNTKKIASTSWAKLGFAILLATNGYIKLPDWMGGWIFQWGYYGGGVSGAISLAYPLTFPNACRGVWGAIANPGTNTTFSVGIGTLTTNAMNMTRTFWNGSTLGGASDATYWFAIGN